MIWGYTKIYLVAFIRNRSAMFFAVLFPSIILLFGAFQTSMIQSQEIKLFILISFMNYAVQTVMFQTLGMMVSAHKNNTWHKYLSTMPVSKLYYIIGIINVMLIICVISLVLASILGFVILPKLSLFPHVAFMMFLKIFIIAIVGGIPMGMFGYLLGSVVNPEASRSIFVTLNIILFFIANIIPVSGLWHKLGLFIPTYLWLLININYSVYNNVDLSSIFCYLAYMFIFLIFSLKCSRFRLRVNK